MALTRKIVHKKGKRHTAVKRGGGFLWNTDEEKEMKRMEKEVANWKKQEEEAAAQKKKQNNSNHVILIEAINNQDSAKVKEILNNKPNLNKTDKNGMTPLHLAVIQENNDIFNLLVDYIANYNKSARFNGREPIHIDMMDNQDRTPLMLLYLSKKYDNAKKLIDNGANINSKNFSGENQLIQILYNPNTTDEMIQKMLDHGADPWMKSKPLSKYSTGMDAFGHVDSLLQDKSIPVEGKEKLVKIKMVLKNFNPKNAARIQSERKSLQNSMWGRGGSSNNYAAMNNFSNGPSKSLIEAVERRNLAEVKDFLAKNSTDVNQKDDRGMTALHHAVEQRDQSIVKELLSHSGLDIDAMNNYNRTALYDAFMYSNHAMIELLIKHGANINVQNKDGKTILMMLLSSTKPNMEMIKLAIGLGSKLDLKDKKGETAVDYAKKQLARVPNSSAMKNLVNSMGSQMGGRRKKRNVTRRRLKK